MSRNGIHHPDFALEDYANRYVGNRRIARLLYVGERCPEHSAAAFGMALQELQMTDNHVLYQHVHQRAVHIFGQQIPNSMVYQTDFVNNKSRICRTVIPPMEQELKKWKQQEDTKQIKDTLEKMGDVHASYGNVTEAIALYEEANAHYRTGDADFLRIAVKLIRVALDNDQYSHATRHVNGISKANLLKNDPVARATAFQAQSLLLIHQGSNQLNKAAEKLLDVPLEGIENQDALMHPTEVVSAVCLSALAFFDRKAISEKLLGGSFKRYLEYFPLWGSIVADWQSCDFASCLANLDSLKLDLLLDKYLGKHVQKLFADIKTRAVIIYFQCFGSLRIPHIAETFNISEDEMEQQLINLIADSKIKARIDSANKVVYARSSSARNASFQLALQTGTDHATELRALLLTLSLTQTKFAVVQEKKSNKGDAGASGVGKA